MVGWLYVLYGVIVLLAVLVIGIYISNAITAARDRQAAARARAQRAAFIRATRSGSGELGALVSVFPIMRRRQWRTAVWASTIGVVVFVAALGMEFLDLSDSSHDHVVPIGGFAVVISVAFFVMVAGIGTGIRYLRHRDEEFRLHEGGVVHADADGTRTIVWNDIDDLEVRKDDGWGMRLLGRSMVVTVKVRGEHRVVITGLTQQAPVLLDAIRGAVYQGNRPRPAG